MKAVWLRVGALSLLLAVGVRATADDREKVIDDIVATTGASRATASQVINSIVDFMHDLQDRISYIASSTDSDGRKDAMARETIEICFVSDNSEVQVASPSSGRVTTRRVKLYLYNLARLKKLFGYTEVQLYFLPRYLGVGRIRTLGGGNYEVSVSAAQIFIGTIYEKRIVEQTTKQFRVQFSLNDDEVIVTVDEIVVSQFTRDPILRQEN
jgi:hypothetical protein